jgi:hypothetical protein
MCPISCLLDRIPFSNYTVEIIYRDPNDTICLGAPVGYEWDKKTPNIKYLIIEHIRGNTTIRHGISKLVLQVYYGDMHDRSHILISDIEMTHIWKLYFGRIENSHYKVAKFLENQFERKASK